MADIVQNQNTFNSAAYLAANPDVAKSGLDPYQHYLQYGQKEGRQATFDRVLSPDEYAQSLPTLEPDGDGGMKYADNPSYSSYLDSLPDAVKQTPQYYANKGTDLANGLFGAFTANNSVMAGGNKVDDWTQQLEDIKKVDPNAYYRAMLHLDMQKAGWDAGQGKSNDITNARIQDEIKNGLAAGIPPEQINNYIKYDYQTTAQGHAKNIASRAGDSTLAGLPQFAGTVGAMFAAPALAGYLTPALGAIGGGAATGAILGGATGGLSAAFGNGNIGQGILKGGLLGGVGGGVAGGISDAFSAANMPTEAQLADYANSTSDPIGTMAQLKSMTPAELAQAFGPGAGETSSNFGSQLASKTGSKLATTELAKALNDNPTAQASGANSGVNSTSTNSSGINLAKLASALSNPSYTPMNVPQIVSKNPFLFDVPGQTQASQGMYDVSGSNLAKALRNA